MKIILYILLFFHSCLTFGGNWEKLQLDINVISLGIQTEYFLHPKWRIHGGIGFGIATVSNFYEHKYQLHSHQNNNWGSDVFGIGKSGLALYAQTGIKFLFASIKNDKYQFYTRYQFKVFSNTFIAFPGGNDRFENNYRNGIYLGFQRSLGAQKKWRLGLESGAALWSNYDWCINRFGPLFNMKWTYRIL